MNLLQCVMLHVLIFLLASQHNHSLRKKSLFWNKRSSAGCNLSTSQVCGGSTDVIVVVYMRHMQGFVYVEVHLLMITGLA